MSRLGLYLRHRARQRLDGPQAKGVRTALKQSRKISKQLWAIVLLSVILGSLIFTVPNLFYTSETPDALLEINPRNLVSAAACVDDPSKSKLLAIPYLLLVLYCFLGLAIVCDEYFEPALSMISEKLELSEDVAGATFMAAGSSAPELFTSISDTFFSKNSIGIGTIVGSAMFNILVIVAMSAAVTKGSVRIDWRPVLRDVTFYLSSIGILVIVMINGPSVCMNVLKEPQDNSTEWAELTSEELELYGIDCGYGIVTWGEGLFMVCVYMLYILVMRFNKTILSKCANKGIKVYDVSQVDDCKQGSGSNDNENDENNDDDDEPWYQMPSGTLAKMYWALSIPLVASLRFTVPNVETERFKNWYLASFFMSIIWIGLFCLAMVNLASEIGCLLGIDPVIMGVVLLAAGTSVPDMIASMIVARQGHADMAIANAVGSNVFDILLGLGLPWFLVGPILKTHTYVDTKDIVSNVIILVMTVVLYLGTIIANKWRMNSRIGLVFTFLYVAYIVYSLVTAV